MKVNQLREEKMVFDLGEIAILDIDCRKDRKRKVNKLAYVYKLYPYSLFEEIHSKMPLLRYSRLGKIYGYECWWVTEEVIVKIIVENNEKIVINNHIKNLDDAINNSSNFIINKLNDKINFIRNLISVRMKKNPELFT